MDKKGKNRQKNKNRAYDDSVVEYSYRKKYKNSRFDDNRKTKEVQQKMFIDWDSI
jgi:hypothetical protein